MKTFSYTMSQKKQKKIKIANTNRDPYLNHPTLISSDYDNISGIRMIEYMKDIHITNITNEFINYFNAFITETGTQDLSNFFDIEIKNISTNLTQLLDNVDNNLSNFVKKNIYEPSVMKINEIHKNNYNFITSFETPIKIKIKNIQDEIFNINKNYKSSLQSFILLDDNNKIYSFNDLDININIKTKNPIDFLYNEEYIDKKYDNNDLLKSIQLTSIDINQNLIYKNINDKNINDKNNNEKIFSFNIPSDLNNNFILLNEDDDKSIFYPNNYNFEINPIKKNNLLENHSTKNDDTIIDNPQLSMNMINIDNLNFLNIKDNYEKNKSKNSDEIINFNKIINYNFNKLFFINDFDMNNKDKNDNENDNENDDENENDNNNENKNKNKNENLNNRTIFSNKNIFLNNNLQYLNTNDIFFKNEIYSNDEILMNNFKINNKLNMIQNNNENIKIKIKENDENTLFSSIQSNLSLNINKFIPKETINEYFTNISEPINLELNIDTDVTKFNNFLNNKIINSNDILKEKQKEFILNGLQTSCNYIINVYQLVYNENKIATGLGDFIRGSYFLIEFCKKYNFKYFIDISNHPIKNFLKKYNKIKLNEKIKNIYKKINKFEQDNFNPIMSTSNNFINNYSNKEIYFNFLEYLSNEEKYDKKIFIYTITFPNEGLINNYKKIMRDIFEPTDKMKLLINIKLKMLELKSYSYEIIHIRCGDEYLSNKIINSDLVNIEFILSDFDKLNPNKKYLLISDNNFIKTFIKKKYNFINILYHDIVHTGENTEIFLKKLENTMLDFYLISKSKNVMSYSVYQHGSGFSKWCAFTYDIPYYCKYFGI